MLSVTMIRWAPAASSTQEDSTAPVGAQTVVPLGRTTSWIRVAVPLVSTRRMRQFWPTAPAPAAAVDLGRSIDRGGHPGGPEVDRRTGGGVVEALGDQPRGAQALAVAGAVADQDRVVAGAGQRAGELIAEGVGADRAAVGAKDLGHRVPGAARRDRADSDLIGVGPGEGKAGKLAGIVDRRGDRGAEGKRRAADRGRELLEHQAVVAGLGARVVGDDDPVGAGGVEQAGGLDGARRRADRGPVGAHDLVDQGRRAVGLDEADAPVLAHRPGAGCGSRSRPLH